MSECDEVVDDSWDPVALPHIKAERTTEPTAADWLQHFGLNFDDLWADDSFRMDFRDTLYSLGADVDALIAERDAALEALQVWREAVYLCMVALLPKEDP